MLDTLLSPNTDATALNANTAGNGVVALSSIPGPKGVLYVYNPGAVLVRVKVGESNVTAGTTSFPLPPGQMQPFNPGSATHIAAWVASGTQALELFSAGGV